MRVDYHDKIGFGTEPKCGGGGKDCGEDGDIEDCERKSGEDDGGCPITWYADEVSAAMLTEQEEDGTGWR